MERTDRTAAFAIAGLAAWLAASWLLSLAHALTRTSVAVLAVVFVAGGVVLAFRGGFQRSAPAGRAFYLVVVLWVLFILWRGFIVPPASHDALSYHLPRAVEIARAGAVERLELHDARMRFPANYELLAAEVMLLTGSDRVTEWIGTAAYLLMLLLTAALARQWWGEGIHITATVLAVASAPLLLLHSGADKNDLLTACFALGALLWSARWCVQGGAAPAALAVACGVMAAGTKITGGAVILAVIPFGIAAIIRRRVPPRALAAGVLFGLVAFLLLGGWVYIQNALADDPSAAGTVAGVPASHYGDWENLWLLPWMILRVSAGFGAAWPWARNELYASDYGGLFALMVVALPFCVWRFRAEGEEEVRRERNIVSGAALIAFLLLLLIEHVPRSGSAAIVRYALFILPVAAAWTIAPIVRALARRARRYAMAAMVAITLLFVQQAVDVARDDTFVPWEAVRWAATYPGTRRVYWMPDRAASVADSVAGPGDTIVVAGSADTWIHPAYGADLKRPVVVLYAWTANAAMVPPAAKWVAVDMLEVSPLAQRNEGLQSVPFFRELAADPRFRLVVRDDVSGQAVFRRVQ